jgi:hypothetical protein
LKVFIHNLAILVYCPPQVVLLAIDFDEDFIDEEGVTIAPVLSLQSAGINCSEFDAPESN